MLIDRGADGFGQRPGITDTGCAAIADQVKSKRVEIFAKAGFVEIIGDDLTAWRQRCFYPRLDTLRPRVRALRATRPAAIMTDGFDVFVHDVIAAIVTSPWPRS